MYMSMVIFLPSTQVFLKWGGIFCFLIFFWKKSPFCSSFNTFGLFGSSDFCQSKPVRIIRKRRPHGHHYPLSIDRPYFVHWQIHTSGNDFVWHPFCFHLPYCFPHLLFVFLTLFNDAFLAAFFSDHVFSPLHFLFEFQSISMNVTSTCFIPPAPLIF